MPTVIDSLVVELGLNIDKYKKGIKEAEHVQDVQDAKLKKSSKQQQSLERKDELERVHRHKEKLHRNKETLEGFSRLRNETLAFLGIFLAGNGIFDFIKGTVMAQVELGHLSDNVDVSVHELAGWGHVLKNAGGTAEEAAAGFAKASEASEKFKLGAGLPEGFSDVKAHSRLNIDLHKGFASAKSTLLMYSEMLSAIEKRDHAEANHYATLLGFGGHWSTVLRKGTDELTKQVEIGAALENQNRGKVRVSENLLRDWNALTAKLKDIGEILLLSVSPAILSVLNQLATFARKKENIKKVTDALGDFSKALKNIDWSETKKGFEDMFFIASKIVTVLTNLVNLLTWISPVLYSDDPEFDDTMSILTGSDLIQAANKQDVGFKKNNTGLFKDSPFGKWLIGNNLIDAPYSATNHFIPAITATSMSQQPETAKQQVFAKQAHHMLGVAKQSSIPKGFDMMHPTNNTTTHDVKVGALNIYTRATDAKGIANELPQAVRNVYNSNSGIN